MKKKEMPSAKKGDPSGRGPGNLKADTTPFSMILSKDFTGLQPHAFRPVNECIFMRELKHSII
jgi:hypothetical protein